MNLNNHPSTKILSQELTNASEILQHLDGAQNKKRCTEDYRTVSQHSPTTTTKPAHHRGRYPTHCESQYKSCPSKPCHQSGPHGPRLHDHASTCRLRPKASLSDRLAPVDSGSRVVSTKPGFMSVSEDLVAKPTLMQG